VRRLRREGRRGGRSSSSSGNNSERLGNLAHQGVYLNPDFDRNGQPLFIQRPRREAVAVMAGSSRGDGGEGARKGAWGTAQGQSGGEKTTTQGAEMLW
jgi:hypothetical protein